MQYRARRYGSRTASCILSVFIRIIFLVCEQIRVKITQTCIDTLYKYTRLYVKYMYIIYMYVCVYVCLCVYVYVYVCACVCVYEHV